MTTLILGSIQLGLLYAVMAMGVYITFRILNLPDLTVDGSFVLGMATAAVITIEGHPYLALLGAVLVGAMAGIMTGILQTKLKMHPILSGILVMTGLYTVNLSIMGGKSNLSLAGKTTLFTTMDKILGNVIYGMKGMLGENQGAELQDKAQVMKEINMFIQRYNIGKILAGLLICIILYALISIFYKTKLGLAIRATGDNEDMVRSSSINADRMKWVGLAMGNGLVALSGALISQYQMFSDVNSGSGMVVMGLASVIIGETLFGKGNVSRGLLTAMIGSIIYRIIIALALKYNIFPAYGLKLVSAIIVAVSLGIPTLVTELKLRKARKEE